MKIIITGSGKVGFTLAEQLVRESHDVTIVDLKEAALRRAADMLDIMAVQGNGVSANVLREAGADSADLVVATTNSDEVNMVCSLVAKNLGAKYTIARIRNPEYNSTLAELRKDLKIDMVINPERATALEISRLLRFPSAANIESFCRGRVELMGFRLQEGDFLVGSSLRTLSSGVKRLSLLFCAVEREGTVLIPNGSFVPRVGDKLYLVGQPDSLDQFFRLLGRYAPKIRRVFLVGGGKISNYLMSLLENTGIQVKVVERREDRCRALQLQHPKATVLCGDGTDQELLESDRYVDGFVLEGEDYKRPKAAPSRLLTPWCGRLTVHVVPFTAIQEELRRSCPEEMFTLVMRRFMMRIAQRVAKRCGAKALVTGESLGQVASQTMDALAVSGDVTDLPILRPVIGMDKEEIVRIARHIGTFETSILPYEDCCTVFTPRHPKTRPHVEEVREMEQALDVEGLVRRAMDGREVVKLR